MPSSRKLGIAATEIRKTQEELMDFLLNRHPSEILVIEAVRGFFRGKTDAEVYKYIRDSVFPHHSKIKSRDLDFFRTNKYDLFKGLPVKYIDVYANLILSSPSADIDQIWEYFVVLVQIFELTIRSKKEK